MHQVTMRVVLLTAVVVLVPLDAARAQCDGTQLCPAGDDPCVVAAPCTVPGDSVFDLGDRELVVDRTTLTLGDAPVDSAVKIRARAVTLTPGARIVAATHGAEEGPWLQMVVTGDFRMESDGTAGSRIDLGGSDFPQIVDVIAGGSVVVNGAIALDAGPRSGLGGTIYLDAAGDVVVEGAGLSARGGDDGNLGAAGGVVALSARGFVRLDAPVDVSGADCAGCDIQIDARGDVFVGGDLDARATDRQFGDGGSVFVDARGSVRLEGAVRAGARGSGGPDEGAGGSGGALIVSGSTVELLGDVDVPGAAPDGFGGLVDAVADRLEVEGRMNVQALGPLGFGGDVGLYGEDGVSIAGVLDADGGDLGGSVDVASRGPLAIAGDITTVGTFESVGIVLGGCDVDVLPGARIEAATTRFRPSIALAARGTMTIAGEIHGPSPANLRFRDRAPVIQPTAFFERPPTLEHVPGLPCCGACVPCAGLPNGSPCDDGDACTSGERCSAGVCTPEHSASCGACELCDGAGGCVAAPRPHCRLASDGGGSLRVRRGPTAARDALSWSWKGTGETSVDELGNPTADTDVALCLFDDAAPAPSLLFRATAPGGVTCGKRPCWQLRAGSSGARGFSYRNALGLPEGVVSASLATSASGRDRMRLAAKGALLGDRPFGLPELPLATPLRAQLQASGGGCWETRHE